MRYTLNDFSQMIDHTNLHADASFDNMVKLCDEAKQYHFKMVAINQTQTATCARLLKDSPVHTGAAISFPLGQTTLRAKSFEVHDAIEKGADEIDYVVNLTAVKNGDFDHVKTEMQTLVSLCHDRNVLCKVIFENCYLTKDEIKKLAQIAKQVQPDFIKTSTGFGSGGATVADVKLMKETVGDTVRVKAAGGIRNSDDFLALIEAGADRIGTSSGIAIIEALKHRFEQDQVSAIELRTGEADKKAPKVGAGTPDDHDTVGEYDLWSDLYE
ncbi:deoxyribose-phosphate aldolase [Ligilactobacillus salitolerans]|uniref:Deoxyribose-phosphate aldolase n=1 Tax=Ligilactobacillus salitolerans TaxID=1808352 RepID=A0A401IRQ5_9LACO|nr:deoxyribose-phosphate aldolase [Ligilactobacillus salitolerans]GBG94185.1 deoxyribose-phosphate aldolase [Ligilactobacillus salitolerans]